MELKCSRSSVELTAGGGILRSLCVALKLTLRLLFGPAGLYCCRRSALQASTPLLELLFLSVLLDFFFTTSLKRYLNWSLLIPDGRSCTFRHAPVWEWVNITGALWSWVHTAQPYQRLNFKKQYCNYGNGQKREVLRWILTQIVLNSFGIWFPWKRMDRWARLDCGPVGSFRVTVFSRHFCSNQVNCLAQKGSQVQPVFHVRVQQLETCGGP